jgi:small multidrug resistance pump
MPLPARAQDAPAAVGNGLAFRWLATIFVFLMSLEVESMNPWFMLAIAIAAELGATTALKFSNGFTKLGPSALVVAGYGVSFYMLAQVLKTQEVGIVYAIWSGAGLAIIALIGVVFLGESVSLYKICGLVAILVGVLLLNLAGKAT